MWDFDAVLICLGWLWLGSVVILLCGWVGAVTKAIRQRPKQWTPPLQMREQDVEARSNQLIAAAVRDHERLEARAAEIVELRGYSPDDPEASYLEACIFARLPLQDALAQIDKYHERTQMK